MKITYSPLQLDIDMPENIIVNLVLENPYDFTEFVMDLQSQFEGEDGLSILSEGSRELNWYKAGSIITDFIGLSVNSKKVLNHLYKLMETIGCEEAELKGNLLTQSVQALEKIISSMKYDCITYNLDFAWHDFFKMFNVHIADDTELLSEKLINYMRVCSDLLGNKILCLVNAKSYFPKKDIMEIYQMSEYFKLHLLMIESRERTDTENEIFYIVDNDHCLIIKDTRLGENQFEV